jgi:tryptophan synthase alpha chain
MSSSLENIFKKTPKNNLAIFVTAGFPKKESLLEIIPILENSACDIIEIGIPYSDPLADGPIIQNSSSIAIENGMTLALIFNQVKQLRPSISKPILLMGYLNSLLSYGVETFYADCHDAGINGLIIPDMPLSEFNAKHLPRIKKYKLHFIFLITPTTKNKRTLQLAKKSSGFLYCVSSNSTTGNKKNGGEPLKEKLNQLKEIGLQIPVMVGFGITRAADFEQVCSLSNGAIIGSGFIELISRSKNLKKDIPQFISSIKSTHDDYSVNT